MRANLSDEAVELSWKSGIGDAASLSLLQLSEGDGIDYEGGLRNGSDLPRGYRLCCQCAGD